MATKTCTLCGRELPATAEFFHAQRLGRDGLTSRCKGCLPELRRARVAADPRQSTQSSGSTLSALRTSGGVRAPLPGPPPRGTASPRPRGRKRDGICEQCGRHDHGQGRRYCSTECGHLASRRRITFACKNCQKTVSVPASHAKFGNPACRPRLMPAGTRTPTLSNSGKIQAQGRGGLRDLRQAGHLANPGGGSIRKRFCSQACMLKWRGPVLSDLRREDHKRREHVCKWCGETFRRLDSQTKDGRGQFCSSSVLGAYTVKYKRQAA